MQQQRERTILHVRTDPQAHLVAVAGGEACGAVRNVLRTGCILLEYYQGAF